MRRATKYGQLHRMNSAAMASHGQRSQRVDIGGVVASREPLLLRTLLGSCVSVCLFDPIERIGGINHILVPSSASDCGCVARCGVQAMELLINDMMRHGADRRRFVAKAFGAGNVLRCFQKPTVGELNARFVREFLKTEGIPLLAERMGGQHAVQLLFHTDTGQAFVRTVDGSRLPAIVREESSYYQTGLVERFRPEEPILF